MFSAGSFSEFAFDQHEYTLLDTSAFEAFLAEEQAKRCWLLELDAFSLAAGDAIGGAFADGTFSDLPYAGGAPSVAGGVQTLRFSTHGYISRIFTNGMAGSDPDAPWFWDGRLSGDIRVNRSITGRDGLGGITRVFAEVTLVNRDGGLDALTLSYSLGGRAARVLIGREDDPLSSFGVLFTGVVETVTTRAGSVYLSLSDGAAKLDRAVNEATYAGTGGLEGGADLKGKRKPRAWGKSFNVRPPLVDSVNLIYQVNDGVIKDVPAVYDRGIALVKVVGAPAAGEYQVDTAAGTFKLGATPSGELTSDVEGDASSAGYVSKTGDIILRLLAIAGLNSSEIEPSSFVQLNGDVPADVGIWVGTEPRAVEECVDELLSGIGAFGGFARNGGYSVGVVKAATGTDVLELKEEDILDGIERLPLPAPVEPIVWRTLVGYKRNYTVQSDFAAAVPAAQRTFAAEPVRIVKKEDAAVKSRYLLAREFGPVPSFYVNEADADTEAQRLFDLWGKQQRGFYSVPTKLKALTRELGKEVYLRHRRLALANGAYARVLGQDVRGARVTLTVLV